MLFADSLCYLNFNKERKHVCMATYFTIYYTKDLYVISDIFIGFKISNIVYQISNTVYTYFISYTRYFTS